MLVEILKYVLICWWLPCSQQSQIQSHVDTSSSRPRSCKAATNDHTFSGFLWSPRASGNENLASAKEAFQHEGEFGFPWLPGSHTNRHHSDGHCEHPKNSCAQPQSLLGHCYSKYLPPNKTTWSSDAQVLNPLECLECVRCEAAGSRKNASFRDQKYVAQSHCTATDHLWDLRLTNSCLLWLCPSQLSGANCLPLGLPWGGNGNIYKRTSTVPVRQYLLDE